MARLSWASVLIGVVGLAVIACGGSTVGVGDPNGQGSSGSAGSSGSSGSSGRDLTKGDGIDGGGDSSSKNGPKVPALHRAVAAPCSHDRGAGDADPQIGNGACSKDADCTAGVNGRCNVTKLAARYNTCSYDTCFSDAECGGKVCSCREASNDANACSTGNCTIDADCGPGGYCSPSRGFQSINLGTSGYWCHTAKDTCVDDADCNDTTGSGPSGAKCAWDPSASRWSCSNQGFYPPGAGGSGG